MMNIVGAFWLSYLHIAGLHLCKYYYWRIFLSEIIQPRASWDLKHAHATRRYTLTWGHHDQSNNKYTREEEPYGMHILCFSLYFSFTTTSNFRWFNQTFWVLFFQTFIFFFSFPFFSCSPLMAIVEWWGCGTTPSDYKLVQMA